MLGLVCLCLTSRMHIFQPGKLCHVWSCLDQQALSSTKTRRLLQHFCNSSTNYRAGTGTSGCISQPCENNNCQTCPALL